MGQPDPRLSRGMVGSGGAHLCRLGRSRPETPPHRGPDPWHNRPLRLLRLRTRLAQGTNPYGQCASLSSPVPQKTGGPAHGGNAVATSVSSAEPLQEAHTKLSHL